MNPWVFLLGAILGFGLVIAGAWLFIHGMMFVFQGILLEASLVHHH